MSADTKGSQLFFERLVSATDQRKVGVWLYTLSETFCVYFTSFLHGSLAMKNGADGTAVAAGKRCHSTTTYNTKNFVRLIGLLLAVHLEGLCAWQYNWRTSFVYVLGKLVAG